MPAWHQLGTIVPGGTSNVDEVLTLGGIDYDVLRRPVEFRNSLDGPRLRLPDHFVTARDDTGAGLGVVGSKYEVLQNRDAFAFLQDLVDRYDVVWESAGAVRGGRRVFISMRLPDTVTIDAAGVADQIVPFIVALNSHDGSSLFQVVVTPWRPVCAQHRTIRAARRAQPVGRAAHPQRPRPHRRGPPHPGPVRHILRTVRRRGGGPGPHPAGPGRVPPGRQRPLAAARPTTPASAPATVTAGGSTSSPTCTPRTRHDWARTAYAAERAITEYADWKQAIRPTGSLRGNNLAARATAVLEGSNDDLKSRAHRHLLTLARRS